MKVVVEFGRKYGRLTPIEQVDPYTVRCVCDCGKVHLANKYALVSGGVKSCGCLRKEKSSVSGTNTIKNNSYKMATEREYFRTSFGIIDNPVPDKRNKSGHKGVWYDRKHNRYEAYITLHRKRHNLGTYGRYEDAVAARENAEEYLFTPLIIARKEIFGGN